MAPRRVVHVVPKAGIFSEVWIDAQVQNARSYDPELWSVDPPVQGFWTSLPSLELRGGVLGRVERRLETRLASVSRHIRRQRIKRWLNGIEVVHAHFGTGGVFISEAAPRGMPPMVVSFYGFDASRADFTQTPWRERYLRMFDLTAAVLVEGPHMASRVERLGCPREKVHVIRLPFSSGEIELPGSPPPPRWDMLLAGRFVEKKGFDIGVRAFAAAFPNGSHRLALLGGGPEEPRLRELVRSFGLHSRVEFLDAVPMSEFPELIRSARLMAFPSITAADGDGEGGAPVTLTLAQALGVPVLVSDHDDLPWAAAPGTPVVPSGDSEALASALAALHLKVTDEKTRSALSQCEIAFVRREHDPERLVTEREALYDLASR